MAQDWYPDIQAALITWHNNFAAQAAINGTTLGLSAAEVTQIAADADNVLIMLDGMEAANVYRGAVADYKALLFNAPADTPTEPVPTAPTTLDFGEGTPAMGIEARTREYAAKIKASSAYTTDDGTLYGIIAPAPAPPGAPAITRATALIDSDVMLKVSKAGYSAVAVDMRRGGGAFSQIGSTISSTFVDETEPLVVGAPEVREYRIQGIDSDNNRVGDVSEITRISTAP
jgi:hypothetical protein